jgi:hypothetical protein
MLLVGTDARAVTELADLQLEYLPFRHEAGSKNASVCIHVGAGSEAPLLVVYQMYNGADG